MALQTTINCGGTLIDVSTPKIMGIINATPDSFFEQSRSQSVASVLKMAEKMLDEGATFLDVGGCSTRPNAATVSLEEELDRVIAPIKALKKAFPQATISIDTYRAEVATQAVEAGATLVNDVGGGTLDDLMFSTIAELGVPYILTHIRGTPQTMQQNTSYDDLIFEVVNYLQKRIFILEKLGAKDIIIDLGFGFGKNLAQNYGLIKNLPNFKTLFKNPILVGVSRKSMVYKLLETTADQALNGSTALHTFALLNGANILRVHDVAPAVEAIKIVNAIQNA